MDRDASDIDASHTDAGHTEALHCQPERSAWLTQFSSLTRRLGARVIAARRRRSAAGNDQMIDGVPGHRRFFSAAARLFAPSLDLPMPARRDPLLVLVPTGARRRPSPCTP